MVRPLLWRLVGDHPTGCCGTELWVLFTVCIRNTPHLRTAFRQSCRAGVFAKTSVSCGPWMQVSSSFLLWLVQILLSVVLAQTLMFLLSLFPSALITTEFLYFLYFFFCFLRSWNHMPWACVCFSLMELCCIFLGILLFGELEWVGLCSFRITVSWKSIPTQKIVLK